MSNISRESMELLNESSNSIHEEAVKELEAVLRRLRSEDPENQNEDERSLGEVKTKLEEPKSPVSDPIEEAREAAGEVEDGAAAAVDENVAPPAFSSPSQHNENSSVLFPPARICAGCQKVEKVRGTFKDCAKCRCAVFCGTACQKSSRKQHKKVCCKTDSRRSLVVNNGVGLNSIHN